jgi:hypothetical protein
VDLKLFFYIFSRKFQKKSEELLSECQANDAALAKHVHVTRNAISMLASTQADLDKFLTIFQVNFRYFL